MRPRLPTPLDRPTLATVLTVLFLSGTLAGAVPSAGAVPNAGADAVAGDDQRAAVEAVDTVRSDTRRTAGETLNVTVTPATIAAGVGDPITVSGEADVDTVRLYLVGPRGAFLDADGNTASMESESGGTFVETYASFTRRGTYTLLVVSPRTDGSFEASESLDRGSLPTGMTHDQAVETVRSAYGGDEVLTLRLRGETPSIGVEPVEDGGISYGEALTVSGTSNRGDGVPVNVDVLDGESRPVASDVATVDAATGQWTTEIDTAELEPGRYTVFADDGASTASATLLIDDGDEDVENETTPAETPIPTDDATDDDATPSASATVDDVTGAALENGTTGVEDAKSAVGAGDGTANATANSSGNATTNGSGNATANGTTDGTASGADGSTSEGLPGFGAGVAIAAVVVAALAGRRRTAR